MQGHSFDRVHATYFVNQGFIQQEKSLNVIGKFSKEHILF